MSMAVHLYRLQTIESQRDQISVRLKEIERTLAGNEAVHQAQEEQAAAENRLHKARQSLRQAEEAVKAQQVKTEQSEAALYGGAVKNPKELQDLQNEVASLKRLISTLEDRQLEGMIEVEDLEAQLRASQQNLEAVLSRVNQEQANLITEQNDLLKDQERLDAERRATLPAIQPDMLELYETLRRQKHGVAVAAVVDRTCAACGSTLTPAEWQGARSPHQISRCPSCGRILYAE